MSLSSSYAPGELKAVATRDGRVAATTVVRTAGPASRIALSADQTQLKAGGRDLSYVTIRMEDEQGRFAPRAARWVNLRIEGPGRVLAVGNGDPLSHESFQGRSVRTFNGLALAIVAADKSADADFKSGAPGEIVLTVHGRGMEPAEVRIRTVR